MLKKRIIIIFLLIIAVFLIHHFWMGTFLTLEKIKAQKYLLKTFVTQNYLLSVSLYILFFTLASFLSLPITVVLNLLAGFLFGALVGALYVNIGTTVGSALSFLTYRYFLGSFVKNTYGDRLKHFDQHIKQYGYSYLLSLQILPATPTLFINVFSGLTSLRLYTFIWTTSIGIIPGSLIYTFAGQQFGAIESTKDILTGPAIIALILLSIVAILPTLIAKFIKK